jgi:hypothetical protein
VAYEDDGVLRDGQVGLLCVGGVVEAETAHRPHVLGGQGRQQRADVGHVVGDVVLAEDVALNDAGLAGLADVGDAAREDGVAVVGPAIAGQEADEALGGVSALFLIYICIHST